MINRILLLFRTDPKNNEKNYPDIVLKENLSGRFESRFSTVKIYKSPAIMLRNMENNTLGIWVAHGEGLSLYFLIILINIYCLHELS